MSKPEKLILDYSKWRCGGHECEENVVGKGITSLFNDDGFSCCLGQWHIQVGIGVDELLTKGEPNELKFPVPPFSYEDEDKWHEGIMKIVNTPLSNLAMEINDNPETTPEEKIQLLTDLLANEGITLEVINKP